MSRCVTYSVRAFADLAGVSVRTLHFYEETGLLLPQRRTAHGHRRYGAAQLLRLQQILTLKYLGFSLDAIRRLLDAPAYDLRGALLAQRTALEDDILRLQGVVYALTRTLDSLEQADGLDWSAVQAVIQALAQSARGAWASQFFPPEQLAWLRTRAAATPPELLTQTMNAWADVYARLAALRHLDPAAPVVQAVAAEMNQLIQIFTAGRPDVELGLAALYQQEPGSAPPAGPPLDPERFRPSRRRR